MYELLFDDTLSMKSLCFNGDRLAWSQSHKLPLKEIIDLLTNYYIRIFIRR